MSTKGQIINCKAAVAYKQDDLRIETIQVHPPKSNEVRVKVKACGLCGGDAHIYRHAPPYAKFPCVLGHEAGGIVESVGDKVKSVSPGDYVMISMIPQCGTCVLCKGDVTNFCHGGTADGSAEKFTMPDGTTRLLTSDGSPLYKILNVGGFAEYVVTTEDCIIKVCKDIPLEKFCLFACGIPTGYGSVYNVSKVKKGTTVAIWGLGAVGLGAILGARDVGAKEIICIARNNEREALCKKFGCTTYINTNDLNEPLEKVLLDKYGGLDAGIDCVGNVDVMTTSLAASKPWGMTVINGTTINPLTVIPISFIPGRKLVGAPYGGWKGKDAIHYFVKKYKSIPLDDVITSYITLDEVGKGFDEMGKNIKTVVRIS